MFKSYPDVIALGDQPNDYDINWEEIARWAIEHGDVNDSPDERCGAANVQDNSPSIDWSKVADSFMREEVDEMDTNACDPSLLNSSINENRSVHLPEEKEYCRNNWQRMVADVEENLPEKYWDHSRREKKYNYSQYMRRKRPDLMNRACERNRSRRTRGSSLFDDSSDLRPPDVSSRDFSCLNASFMQDTTSQPKSDILDYLETNYSNVRPQSIMEGYHFPGRAYDTRVRQCDAKIYMSTPKKRRSTLTESFEMVDGSKMFNITLEEILEIGRQLKHITEVRDCNGCEIIHIERDINTDMRGVTHRKEKVRRYLDSD